MSPNKKYFENIVGKGENAVNQHAYETVEKHCEEEMQNNQHCLTVLKRLTFTGM